MLGTAWLTDRRKKIRLVHKLRILRVLTGRDLVNGWDPVAIRQGPPQERIREFQMAELRGGILEKMIIEELDAMKNFMNCRRNTSRTVGAVAMPFVLAICLAASAQAADISISNATAQIRDDAMNGRRIEVYMSIENTGAAADRLYAVRSKVSRKTMISVVQGAGHGMDVAGHAMKGQPGMAQHMQTSVLDLPAGETVVLKRGQSHIMLMDPPRMPAEGETVPLTLFFERGGSVSVVATVAPMQMQMGH